MIDVRLLKSSALSELEPGNLFVSLGDDHPNDPILAGRAGPTDVLVALRGEQPFLLAKRQQWAERRGYAIPEVRFEADRSTARLLQSVRDARPGELLSHYNGYGLATSDRSAIYLVDLGPDAKPDQGTGALVAFNRWEIAIGDGVDRQILYHYTGSELLFGSFDPNVD